MRIEKVVIENLNSIEKAEICFNEGVLAHEPLFLICGETGTGKSTILDAITLALFDKSPRYEDSNSSEYIENGNSKVNSTTNILRKGTSECKAELTFSVGNQTYIAIWRIRKTRNNTYSLTNRRLLTLADGTVVADTITSVNETIKDIIGLNYEQFLRSVLLAQGQFSTFLNSEKHKQTEILELLTGTEIYSRIALAIKEERKKAETEKNNAKISLQTIDEHIITEEEEQVLKERLNQFDDLQRDLSDKIKKNDEALKWMTDFVRLQQELFDYKTKLDEATKCLNSDETISFRDIIRDYKSTEEVRDYKRRSDENMKEMSDCEREINLLRARFTKYLASFNSFKIQKETLSSDLEKLRIYIENHKSEEVLYDNVKLVIALLNDAAAAEASCSELDKQKSDNENVKIGNNELRLLKEKERLKLTEEYNLLNDNLKQKDIEISTLNIESLNNDYKTINDSIRLKTDRIVRLEKITDILNQYFNLKNIISDKEKELASTESKFSDVCSRFVIAEDRYKNADNVFKNMQVLAEDWIKEYRAKLKDGEPCPLCGSLEHQYKDESIVDSLLDTVEKERDKTRNEYLSVLEEKNGLDSKLKSLHDAIRENKTVLSGYEQRLNELCDNKPVYDIAKINDVINKRRAEVEDLKIQSEKISEKISSARKLQSEYNKLRDKLDAKKHIVNNIEKEILEIMKNIEIVSNKIADIEREKTNKEVLRNEKVVEVQKYMLNDGWYSEWEKDKVGYSRSLAQHAENWFKVKDDYENVRRKVDEYESIDKQSLGFIEKIISLIPEWNFDVTDRASFVVENMVSDFSSLYYETKSSVENLMNKRRQYESNVSFVADFLKNNLLNINKERLYFLYKVNDIGEYEKQLRDKEYSFNKAKNSYNLKYNDLQNHQSVMTLSPDTSVASLKAENERLELENTKVIEERTRIKTELGSNADKKQEILKYKELYRIKEEEYALWHRLADTIGTSESNNFRHVAQLYTLNILLERSNYFLRQISNRYEFSRSMDTWAIMVIDKNMGGVERVVSSLSGGETFIVSLALALGLAALNDTGFSVNMLFIDEGFGSLDYDSLDMVMGVLENLNRLGRQVGIISHVEMLRDRVPAKIQLKRTGNSASEVVILKS